MATFLIIYNDGQQVIVKEETWRDIMPYVNCATLSITMLPDKQEENHNIAVEALKRIKESDPGPAYYIAKRALDEMSS